MKSACSIAAIAAAAWFAPTARPQSAEAVAELLKGVNEIAAPGTPSPLCAWNPDAWVVLVGNAGNGLKAPAVVAGRASSGRFVVLPHDGYFGAGVLAKADTARFLKNAVRWAAGPAKQKPKVAARGQELVDLLRQAGCDVHLLGAESRPLRDELASVDVVVGLSNDLAVADVEPLERFLYGGGGVVAGQCAWGWQQTVQASTLEANPLNRFFRRVGVAWTDGYLGKVGDVGFTVERTPPKLAHADSAVTYLTNHRDSSKLDNSHPMLQATATAMALLRVVPREDAFQWPRLEKLLGQLGDTLAPSPEHPLTAIDGAQRVALCFALRDAETRAPETIAPLGLSKVFPGEVAADAPRIARRVAIDTIVPRWHSTGLYAPAGEAITVRLPAKTAESDPSRAGLVLQIGAHTDELFDLDDWQRAPKAVQRVALDAETVVAASPLGGLVYVDVPEECPLGRIELGFGHVVEAPHFVLDRTTNDEWRGSLRAKPAPWAELESGKIVVTVPSSSIRALDDPEALMRTWDRASDAAADLVGMARARQSPERFVADVQIAAGYMHAGYPIMTHLDAAAVMADPAALAQGDWGLFHEFGHNHQSEEWTFEGTGEVTNNVICLYLLETVCGRKPTPGDKLFAGLDEGRQKIAAYVAGGAKFEQWRRDPFLALQSYVQVQQAFGWEPFKKCFAEYRRTSRRDKPKTDDAKRDLWLVTLSKACHRNLAPFFTAWGIPTSESARAAVADLAEWMPEGFPAR